VPHRGLEAEVTVMPITCEFEYHRPKELSRALELLVRGGERAAVLAGGTDLLVWMKEGLHAPTLLVDVKAIADLHRLRRQGDALFIGAAVTFSELIESTVVREQLPLLWECSRTVASVGIRNRATLVGNICSAVPSLDGAPALLAYEAKITVAGGSGGREIPVREWFLGPRKTTLRTGEVATGVLVPLPPAKSGACYVKLGRYRGEDLAQVGLGILVLPHDEYRLAFCAVAPAPARATRIEQLLSGKSLSDSLIRQAKELVSEEIRPITDIRATKEYRLHMARVMLERGLKAAVARRDGNGHSIPAYGESVI